MEDLKNVCLRVIACHLFEQEHRTSDICDALRNLPEELRENILQRANAYLGNRLCTPTNLPYYLALYPSLLCLGETSSTTTLKVSN